MLLYLGVSVIRWPRDIDTSPVLSKPPGTRSFALRLPTDPHTGRAIVPEKDWIAAADMRKAMAAAARDASAYKRDMNDVLCYKCGEYNHFANACPNSARLSGYRERRADR